MKKGMNLKFKVKDSQGKIYEFESINKVSVISIYPKLNTSVCDEQTIHILELAKQYPDINFVSISNDSVKTIEKWCGTHHVTNSNIYSDKELGEFAKATGLKIPVLNIFKRGFIVVKDNMVMYSEINDSIKKQIDFKSLQWAIDNSKNSFC